jgi:hypothetical protein
VDYIVVQIIQENMLIQFVNIFSNKAINYILFNFK